MEISKELVILFDKYLNGQCTEEEIVQLEAHFGVDDADGQLQLLIEAYFHQTDVIEPVQQAAADELAASAYPNVIAAIETVPPTRKLNFRWLPYAAAIFIVALATALYFYQSQLIVNRTSKIVNEIGPGGNRATLTLADGTKVELDSAQRGIIINEEDIKYNDGKNVLAEKGRGPVAPEESIINNSLTTPKGGQYQIILSDGTKVWINAASTLIYPSRFLGDKREVELEGEAYFSVNDKVAGDRVSRMPFIVKSKNQQITVLGTEFNINSYEPEVKTTLASGAIRVTSSAGVPLVLGVPGEQSILQNNGNLTKSKTDIFSAIAWKENRFSFDNKPFTQIMNEMARWYNFEVLYEGPKPTNRLMGGAFRTDKLSTVLRFLENLELSYRVEATSDHGHRLVIINNKGGKTKK
ncbi:FecR family protein [bacterium A37T11]|nr:FecR family protein [bacterium A37T11]